MPFTPLFSGTTSGGRALFQCPNCHETSGTGEFRIDNKAKSMYHPKCGRMDKMKAFIIAPPAPAGSVTTFSMIIGCMLLAGFIVLLVRVFPAEPKTKHMPFPSPVTARAAAAEWARLSKEQGIRCRQQMAALGRALDQDEYEIPEKSEVFYRECMGMYSEE